MPAKPCKYGCNQQLVWDTSNSRFNEQDGTAHTKERCAYMKSLQPKPTTPSSPKPDESGAAKGHAENIQMHKEMLGAVNALIEAVKANTLALKAKESVEDVNRMHLENIDRNLMKAIRLPTADELVPAATVKISSTNKEES